MGAAAAAVEEEENTDRGRRDPTNSRDRPAALARRVSAIHPTAAEFPTAKFPISALANLHRRSVSAGSSLPLPTTVSPTTRRRRKRNIRPKIRARPLFALAGVVRSSL